MKMLARSSNAVAVARTTGSNFDHQSLPAPGLSEPPSPGPTTGEVGSHAWERRSPSSDRPAHPGNSGNVVNSDWLQQDNRRKAEFQLAPKGQQRHSALSDRSKQLHRPWYWLVRCRGWTRGGPRRTRAREVELLLLGRPDRGNVVARRLARSAAIDQRQPPALGDRGGKVRTLCSFQLRTSMISASDAPSLRRNMPVTCRWHRLWMPC
jgi:hypothetical protein